MSQARKEKKQTNPVTLKSGMRIGSISAETDDEFLLSCFEHNQSIDVCINVNSPSMVISGRTGAGKTAIIKYIENKMENVAVVDPIEMALSYVTNSDSLRFVQAIGGDLDILFQSLWKHVLCIEFIRLRYSVIDEERSKNIFVRLYQSFSKEPRKERALKYLKEWEGRFWITMDQNIKEVTEKYEKQIQAEFGAELQKFKTRGSYEKQMGIDRKSEIIVRIKKIINSQQLIDLSNVISMLSDTSFDDAMSKYFILIDKLDEVWVDIEIKYKLIRALVESLKKFRCIKSLKILVALRTDIIEKVFQETNDLTFQREKVNEYFAKIQWDKEDLKSLINKRISFLFRKQYTNQEIKFDDIFKTKVANKHPFDYMVERTLMRPRDIIDFVNFCLIKASGNGEITLRNLRDSELSYSDSRKNALEQEWASVFPTLPLLLDFISASKKASISGKDIFQKEKVEDLIVKIVIDKYKEDNLHEQAVNSMSSNNGYKEFIKKVLEVLYRVGAIGIKFAPDQKTIYSHIDRPIVNMSNCDEQIRIQIHPMLHRGLNVT